MTKLVLVPKIKERLAEIGERQVWLAAQTGIPSPAICRICNGRQVNLMTAVLIASALRCPIEKLWEIKEEEVDE